MLIKEIHSVYVKLDSIIARFHLEIINQNVDQETGLYKHHIHTFY